MYTYYVAYSGMNAGRLQLSSTFISRYKKISDMDDVLEITQNLSVGVLSDITLISWYLLEC